MANRLHQDGTVSPITVITDMSPTSVISYLGDHRHLTKDDLEDMMASLQLLFEAQQAGRNITEQKAWVDYQELWELLNVECVGEWEEDTLQLLREEHQATAERRKRVRGPEEEPLARPLKRVKRM
jgi:broad specificity phosphatase PhoE